MTLLYNYEFKSDESKSLKEESTEDRDYFLHTHKPIMQLQHIMKSFNKHIFTVMYNLDG